MSYILGAIVILFWIALFFGAFVLIFNTHDGYGAVVFKKDIHNYLLGITGLVLCIAGLLWIVSNSDDSPCLRYETTMQYNPSTKTTMPVQFCAEYGEWVDSK